MCASTDSVHITVTHRMPFVEKRTCWRARLLRTCRLKMFWRERRGGTRGDAATTSGRRPNGKQVSANRDIV